MAMLSLQMGIFHTSPKFDKTVLAAATIRNLFFSKKSQIHLYRHILSTRQCHLRLIHASAVMHSNVTFNFGVAASFSAKHQQFNSNRDFFRYNPSQVEVSRKKTKADRPASGQDAFFVSRVGKTSDIAFGIADGVGGWGDLGVDPADFAHGICESLAHVASTYEPEKWGSKFNPQSLLQRGYDDLCQDGSVLAGSSTACVAVARGNGLLEIANLGDSGFMLFRLNTIYSFSNPQTHDFNTPYQLSIIPEDTRKRAATYGSPCLQDLPKDANTSQHYLKNGDVLVLGSDGIWDNLSGSEVLKIISAIMIKANAWKYNSAGVEVGPSLRNLIGSSRTFGQNEADDLQSLLAVSITAEAKSASNNKKKNGPFAIQAKKYFPGTHWSGGKVDDICLLVAIACEMT